MFALLRLLLKLETGTSMTDDTRDTQMLLMVYLHATKQTLIINLDLPKNVSRVKLSSHMRIHQTPRNPPTLLPLSLHIQACAASYHI